MRTALATASSTGLAGRRSPASAGRGRRRSRARFHGASARSAFFRATKAAKSSGGRWPLKLSGQGKRRRALRNARCGGFRAAGEAGSNSAGSKHKRGRPPDTLGTRREPLRGLQLDRVVGCYLLPSTSDCDGLLGLRGNEGELCRGTHGSGMRATRLPSRAEPPSWISTTRRARFFRCDAPEKITRPERRRRRSATRSGATRRRRSR